MSFAIALPDLSTAEDYVRWMEGQDRKYEMMSGRLVMMAGGTNPHATIALNTATALRSRLRGTPCRPFNSDFLVEVDSNNRFYPDVSVACNETRNYTNRPLLLVEVLSPKTERFDLTFKLEAYMRISGIQYILYLWQDEPRARLYAPGQIAAEIEGLDAIVELPMMGVSLPMRELYEDVEPA